MVSEILEGRGRGVPTTKKNNDLGGKEQIGILRYAYHLRVLARLLSFLQKKATISLTSRQIPALI